MRQLAERFMSAKTYRKKQDFPFPLKEKLVESRCS